jgi:hypothetical protein
MGGDAQRQASPQRQLRVVFRPLPRRRPGNPQDSSLCATDLAAFGTAKVNGGGFLTDYFPNAYKAIWDFDGQQATSRHLPGIRYTGITHPGLFGTTPSADLLAKWMNGSAR